MLKRRTEGFSARAHPRYWWFQQFNPDYDPPVFAMLDDREWQIMEEWYRKSEEDHPAGTGECAIPAISFLHGLISGNNIRRVVQLGHFIGFSTLLLGFMLRRMGASNALFSIDLDPNVTEYTGSWVARAGLQEHVRLKVADSAEPANPEAAKTYLGGPPQLIFIDSSHQYAHTLRELDVWYPALQPGGFIMMHDVSAFAASFDHTGGGGVAKAVREWLGRSHSAGHVMINGNLTNQGGHLLTYTDGCGLGFIQKPLEAIAAS